MSVDVKALRALRDAWDAAIESGPSSKIEDAYNAVTEAVMEDLDALIDAADPEVLRFGPEYDGARRGIAVDGRQYWMSRVYVGSTTWHFMVPDTIFDEFATEAEAIEAAREHDRARRNVTPPRAAGDGR